MIFFPREEKHYLVSQRVSPYSEKCSSFQLSRLDFRLPETALRRGLLIGAGRSLSSTPHCGLRLPWVRGSASWACSTSSVFHSSCLKFFSAVPELMSFPPWQTASALLRLRYVTRRWGWVGASGGSSEESRRELPARAQDC